MFNLKKKEDEPVLYQEYKSEKEKLRLVEPEMEDKEDDIEEEAGNRTVVYGILAAAALLLVMVLIIGSNDTIRMAIFGSKYNAMDSNNQAKEESLLASVGGENAGIRTDVISSSSTSKNVNNKSTDTDSNMTEQSTVADSYDEAELSQDTLIESGTDGQNGLNGQNGELGTTGKPGKPGLSGKDGKNGQNGLNGMDGTNGRDGEEGQDGLAGKDGGDGLDGIDGRNGKDGASGLNGANGKDGASGLDGEKGKDGSSGLDGANGKDGASGLDGASGKDGVSGLDGANGKDGISGLDGANGLNGLNGQDGASGKSAFQVAKEGGYTGTEEEFTRLMGSFYADVAKLNTDVTKNSGDIFNVNENLNTKTASLESGLNGLGTSVTNLGNRVDDCFQSVSDGKALLAGAITDKGISASASEDFANLAGKIRMITNTSLSGNIKYTYHSHVTGCDTRCSGTVKKYNTRWHNEHKYYIYDYRCSQCSFSTEHHRTEPGDYRCEVVTTTCGKTTSTIEKAEIIFD